MKSGILVLIILAAFVGYKYWRLNEKWDGLNEQPQAVSTDQGVAQQPVPAQNNTPENQQKALDGIVNLLRGKGANIIDKRVFNDLASCEAGMNKVVGEYQRRGINPSNVADGTAFMGAPGKAMVMLHGDIAYYVACMDFSQYGWAGYVHYSLTMEQVNAISNSQIKNAPAR